MIQTPHLEQEPTQERGTLPTRQTTEMAAYEDPFARVDELPQGAFSNHEGLIAFKKPGSENIYMTLDTATARRQLAQEGIEDGGGEFSVPRTGARGADRLDPYFAAKEARMGYNQAAVEAGLKQLDTDQLDEAQRGQLQDLGFLSTALHAPALFKEGYAMFASRPGDVVSGDVSEKVKLEDVGTYSRATEFIDGREIASIRLTDQVGNQCVIPFSEASKDLLDSLGYRVSDQPTFDAQDLFAADPYSLNGSDQAKKRETAAFLETAVHLQR